MRSDFAVFILSHGRADNVITVRTLEKLGYTGDWYVIIDDEDEQAETYYQNYGQDHVIMFSKDESALITDTADLIEKRNTVLFARNMCHGIAESLGLTYFLELDDDYKDFQYRYTEGNKLKVKQINDLDSIFEAMIEFLDVSGAKTVTFAQGGDFLGGAQSSTIQKGLLRKAMNTFFCRTDRPFKFHGRCNDDVNTYLLGNNRGDLFLTVSLAMVLQGQTQHNKGGLTEMYLELGTYTKSFYSVVHAPQAVKVSTINSDHSRIHHLINYDHCAPKILSENYRKPNEES